MSIIPTVTVMLAGIMVVGFPCFVAGYFFAPYWIRTRHPDNDGLAIYASLGKPVNVVFWTLAAIFLILIAVQFQFHTFASTLRNGVFSSLLRFVTTKGKWSGIPYTDFPNCIDFFLGAIVGTWLGWSLGLWTAARQIGRSQGIPLRGYMPLLRR